MADDFAPKPGSPPKPKKPYRKPTLMHLGSVHDLTLGGTKGHIEPGGRRGRG